MTQTAYILNLEEYDYESSYIRTFFASLDRNKIEEKKIEMEARRVRAKEIKKEICSAIQMWEDNNPKPDWKNPVFKNLPIFKGKRSKWTDEQKKQYKEVSLENQQISINANIPYREWMEARFDEQKRLVELCTEQEQEDLNNLDNEGTWEIIEVPFV